eukprot:CAMPEP_0184644590 /NCGR_PEP_ID=MMETSP0308-20130426/1293_1 /TAXON_ID=38269 /ORGANISM="Gloeochaete witrockiana, Strain SAG 46.84" /LENGTH=382 /DNA_ID=CAMNT_0027073215 /DNA_START=126 /DNA_END=1271 /DNA_ORIENTATION=-
MIDFLKNLRSALSGKDRNWIREESLSSESNLLSILQTVVGLNVAGSYSLAFESGDGTKFERNLLCLNALSFAFAFVSIYAAFGCLYFLQVSAYHPSRYERATEDDKDADDVILEPLIANRLQRMEIAAVIYAILSLGLNLVAISWKAFDKSTDGGDQVVGGYVYGTVVGVSVFVSVWYVTSLLVTLFCRNPDSWYKLNFEELLYLPTAHSPTANPIHYRNPRNVRGFVELIQYVESYKRVQLNWRHESTIDFHDPSPSVNRDLRFICHPYLISKTLGHKTDWSQRFAFQVEVDVRGQDYHYDLINGPYASLVVLDLHDTSGKKIRWVPSADALVLFRIVPCRSWSKPSITFKKGLEESEVEIVCVGMSWEDQEALKARATMW